MTSGYLEANKAFSGGALSLEGGAASQTISGTTFKSNEGYDAQYTGAAATEPTAGGAMMASGGSAASFTSCTWVSNQAGRAGAVLVTGVSTNVIMSHNNFTQNQAVAATPGGGAITAQSS